MILKFFGPEKTDDPHAEFPIHAAPAHDEKLLRAERTRFFDIDVLPGAHRRNRRICMEVVGSRGDDGVDVLHLKHLAEILLLAHGKALYRAEMRRREIERARIDVADAYDLHPGVLYRAGGGHQPAPGLATANEREAYPLRRRGRPERPPCRRDRKHPRPVLQKIPSAHEHPPWF